MTDEIFISYASEDRARVESLARFLEAAGWSVWWDREIPIGRTFDEVIEKALDAARCVIVVWTEASVASEWVKTEASEGLQRKILAPVMMDEVRIPLEFKRVQAANLAGWQGERAHPGIGPLIAAVTHFAGPPRKDTIPPPIALEPETDEAPEPGGAEESKTDAASEAEERIIVKDEGSEVDPPQKLVPGWLEPWIKEPKRLLLVAAGVIVIAVILIIVMQKDDPPLPPDSQASVASIDIDQSEATVYVDSTVQLTATLRDSLNKPLDRLVGWTSSNSSIALVDSAGVVTGLKVDSTQIIVRSEGVADTITVSVLPNIAFTTIPGRSWSMGTYEVTQGQWKAVMGTEPWKGGDNLREGDDYPALYVSWNDAQAFIAKLNELDSRYRYRLPTEAEWEYACRAGSTTAYSFGDDESRLGDYAWYSVNTAQAGEPYPHRVGQKEENRWGLYDVHGNVWEWTQTQTEYQGAVHRVIRGGSFVYPAEFARSAYRGNTVSETHDSTIGFRLLRETR